MLVNNSSMYVRNSADCFEIQSGIGEFVWELLGVNNGNCEQLSTALVKILQGGCSQAHYHMDREEVYLMKSGEARLVVDGEVRVLKPGDVAHIPQGAVHQIFNESKQELIFNCICAPAWIIEDYNFDLSSKKDQHKAPTVIEKDAETKCIDNEESSTYKLLGREPELGEAQKIQISLIEVLVGKALSTKPVKSDGCYIIKEGSGSFSIDDDEKQVEPGEVAKIPANVIARITNTGKTVLKLYHINSTI